MKEKPSEFAKKTHALKLAAHDFLREAALRGELMAPSTKGSHIIVQVDLGPPANEGSAPQTVTVAANYPGLITELKSGHVCVGVELLGAWSAP